MIGAPNPWKIQPSIEEANISGPIWLNERERRTPRVVILQSDHRT